MESTGIGFSIFILKPVTSPVRLPNHFPPGSSTPFVTVQVPLYNEMYVAERVIDYCARLDYPKDKFEIQVLDDSVDETVEIVQRRVQYWQSQGIQIKQLRRPHRKGFKAGALGFGLTEGQGELVAIFDADFMPPPDFLKKTVPHFSSPNVGMVQTRWGHINADYSLLTRLQALFLDGHFLLEHTARFKSGAFFNFNGTGGIWRKEAIVNSGGWKSRTLTEDMDLSYRAQLKGWRFIYLSDYVCPAELPVDIHAFRTQQKRWTKGAIQVARFLLRDIWRAPIPFLTKFESTAHLTANLAYLLTFLVSLLLLPSLVLRHYIDWSPLPWLEGAVFVTTMISVGVFYAVSQKELYPDWRWRLRDIPALLSFGIGMCIGNTKAVWEGLMGQTTDFQRTPKYGIKKGGEGWVQKVYARDGCQVWSIQMGFAIYSVVTFGVAALMSNWGALPFLMLFVFGFSYIGVLSFLHKNQAGCR